MRGVGKTLLVLGAVLACQQAVAGEDAPEDNLVTVRGEVRVLLAGLKLRRQEPATPSATLSRAVGETCPRL